MESMSAEQNALVEEWFPRVRKEVRKFLATHSKGNYHADDINSAMVEGLLKAVRASDTHNDSYILGYMWNQAKEYVRREKYVRKNLEEMRPDEAYEDDLLYLDIDRTLAALAQLPKCPRNVIYQHFWEGKDFVEISGDPMKGGPWHKTRECYENGLVELRRILGVER